MNLKNGLYEQVLFLSLDFVSVSSIISATVPQVCILSLSIFLLNINDLSSISILIYRVADDSTLHNSSKTILVAETKSSRVSPVNFELTDTDAIS